MRAPRAVRGVCAVLLFAGPALPVASCGGADPRSIFDVDGSVKDGSTSDSPSFGDISFIPPDGPAGGDANPNVNPGCKPTTCAAGGYSCGINGDGCGGTIDCGSCPAPEVCGGGGYSRCGGVAQQPDGAPLCVPTTCAALGHDCGPAGDGCGGLLQCGTCTGNEVCGATQPSVCGSGIACTGLCKQQGACDGGTPTTITGRVVAGTVAPYLSAAGPDPVPGVLVYVPNAPLTPFAPAVQCGCPQASGDPLVWTTTAVDGTFTLTNVPVGTAIPVVIQLGRWRREVTFDIAPASACESTAVGDIHMPRTHTDGNGGQADIPLTALSTGMVDAMECVLLKMGIDPSEFTNPAGGGRVQLYTGNGAAAPGGSPAEAQLTDSLSTLENYDVVILPCWGHPYDKPAADLQNLVSYTSAGGRVFATHFSYTWLYQNSPFDTTATWDPDTQYTQTLGQVDTSFARGATFGQWMVLVGATAGAPPSFPVQSPRQDFANPVPPSLRYLYSNDNGGYPLHYTFDTPWQAASTCGRVEYSDFHVSGNSAGTFPGECPQAPMTLQEKALEYMIYDLSQCLGSNTPKCTPLSCQQQNIGCGPAGDGCGNVIQCGACTAPQTCGGGGVGGQCGVSDTGPCAPTTCAKLGVQCGPAGDGCGGLLQCGTCASGSCGGGGVAGVCGGGVVQ